MERLQLFTNWLGKVTKFHTSLYYSRSNRNWQRETIRHKVLSKVIGLVIENLDKFAFQFEVNSKWGGVASILQCRLLQLGFKELNRKHFYLYYLNILVAYKTSIYLIRRSPLVILMGPRLCGKWLIGS